MAKKDGKFWIDKKGNNIHPDNVKASDKIKDELVEKLIKTSLDLSCILNKFKKDAVGETDDYFELLLQDYGLDERKGSKKGNYTLENFSGLAKIEIKNQDKISFDEKLQIAKMKVDEYLHELTEDSPPDIQTLISKSFEVDKKGNVDHQKILTLKSYDITHPKWLEAMKIIDDSIEIVGSKSYMRFYTRKSIDDKYEIVLLDVAKV